MKIRISEQVAGFVKGLAPEPRRKLRLAMKRLAKGQGDIKVLDGPLASYSRLRVSEFRIIFYPRGLNEIECIYAEKRSIVYEVFAAALRESFGKKGKPETRE
jgi:mRNA-degrading endonuclease RelE of RelBE toxin-antitoxin system